jgi:hypothetical protein
MQQEQINLRKYYEYKPCNRSHRTASTSPTFAGLTLCVLGSPPCRKVTARRVGEQNRSCNAGALKVGRWAQRNEVCEDRPRRSDSQFRLSSSISWARPAYRPFVGPDDPFLTSL